MKWGNKIMALRWNHQYGPKLFMNTTINYSNYKFNTGFGNKTYEVDNEKNPVDNFTFDYDSGINDWGGKLDFYYYLNPNNEIKFGIGETYHTFKPGVNQLNLVEGGASIDTSFGSKQIYSHEFYAFIQDDVKIGKRLAVNFGLHFSNFLVREKYYSSLQPRIAINYKLDEKSSLKLSYAKTAQFLHLLTNTSIGLPTDLWVPATDSIPPQTGHQFAAGYTRELPKGFRISVEGYYKTMSNLIEYKEGASFFGSNQDWENLVEVGDGVSYGAEILFEKKMGKTTGWIGYTLSWTNRKFENLNDGKTYPYRYDRRHDVSFVLTHKFNDKIDIGIVWVYGTGNAVSMAFQKYHYYQGLGGVNNGNYQTQTIDQYASKNNYRMPSYHRLDIGVNIHKEKKWGTATWSFGIYNAYNRKNPFYLEVGYSNQLDNHGFSKLGLIQYSLFPLIPSISYAFKF